MVRKNGIQVHGYSQSAKITKLFTLKLCRSIHLTLFLATEPVSWTFIDRSIFLKPTITRL